MVFFPRIDIVGLFLTTDFLQLGESISHYDTVAVVFVILHKFMIFSN